MEIGPADARQYWSYIAQAYSADRQVRLDAKDPSGPLWRNFDQITWCIQVGGQAAADVAVLIAECATTPEQISFLVAGPFEDLRHVDAQAFYDCVVPRLSAAVLQAAIRGMDPML